MFDEKNMNRDDVLSKRLERLSGQINPSPALKKAAKTGVPLRSTGIRYTAGMHIRKFSKAVLAYAAGVAILLGGVFLLPKLFENSDLVVTQPSQTTTTEPAPTECEHKYVISSYVPDDPCTTGPRDEYICELCGHRYTKSHPPLGHEFVGGVCTRCGEKEELPPPADCEHGQDLTTCPYCNCDGHEFADNTCTKCGLVCEHEYRIESSFFTHPCTGYKTERGVCLLCGHTYEKNIDNVGHNYVDGICTKCGTECMHEYSGVNGGICTKCGTECMHNYSEGTCNVVCTLCGSLQGHNYEEIVSTDRICTEGTVTTTTCRRCGYSYTEITPAKGHSYENGACTVCGEKQKTVTVTDPDVTAGSVSLLPGQMYQTYPTLSGDGITWVDPTMTPYYYNVYTYFEGYTVTDIRVPVYYAEKGSVLTIGVAKVENGLITDRIASYELTTDREIDREWVLFSGLSIEVPEGCTLTFGWMSDTLSYASPVTGYIPGYSRQDDYSGLGSQIPLIFDVYGKKS